MITNFKRLALIFLVLLTFFTAPLLAQEPPSEMTPFECTNVAYQTVSNGSNSTTLYAYDINTGTRTTVRTLPYAVNAVVYSPIDNYMYASRSGTPNNQIIKFGLTGDSVITVTGLEYCNNGAVTNDGYMFIANNQPIVRTRYYVLDINPNRPDTYGKLVDPTSETFPYPAKTAAPYYTSLANGASLNTSDMAYNPEDGLFYGINGPIWAGGGADPNRFKLATLDIKTGVLTLSSGLVTGGGIQSEGSAYGSVFFDGTGSLYVFANLQGRYYKIDITNLTSVQVGPTVAANENNDGASCPFAIFENVAISGNVFYDVNGLTDNIVNGTGTNGGGTLSVVLWDIDEGKILDIASVEPDGTYILAAAPGKNYNIILTSEPGTLGSTTPPSVVLPAGWSVTGQKVGSGTGSDGEPSGILSNVVIGNDDVSSVNFGISQQPESHDSVLPIDGPPVPNQNIPLTGLIKGSDAEDFPDGDPNGEDWTGRSIVITSLPTNGFALYYNNNPITDLGENGYRIDNFDPSQLTLQLVDPVSGVDVTSFTYSVIDATGLQDPTPATVSVQFSEALPVIFGAISAFFENNNLTIEWEVLKEENNSHFIVELSSDGVHFKQIGKVSSKAIGGNSDIPLTYTFSKSINPVVLGLSFLTFLVGGILCRRKRWIASLLICFGCIGILYSCSKSDLDKLNKDSSKYFVRIAQVDKDGTTTYSKTITVIKK